MAARVGEHMAVVWKRLYAIPSLTTRFIAPLVDRFLHRTAGDARRRCRWERQGILFDCFVSRAHSFFPSFTTLEQTDYCERASLQNTVPRPRTGKNTSPHRDRL